MEPVKLRPWVTGIAALIFFFTSALALSYTLSMWQESEEACRGSSRLRYWLELWAWFSLCAAATMLASALTDGPMLPV